jgi:predicted TIM-barrel fold metal-dependent hydrolase
MRNYPIVDTHAHILMGKGLPYQSLKGNYTITEYNKSMEEVAVDTIIFMECDCRLSHYREEVAFASGLAHIDPRIQGIVAAMPLEHGEKIVDEIAELVKNPLVKGVRRLLKFEEETFCLNEDFIIGVNALGAYNLSFDICTSLEQNRHIPKFVAQCPDVQFMFDHIATPDIRGNQFELWSRGISEIASFENVWCKLSSIATEAVLGNWKEEDIEPYISHVISAFGTNRLVFGSDWPVSLSNATIIQSLELLDKLLGALTPTEQRNIYRENALNFYKIGK